MKDDIASKQKAIYTLLSKFGDAFSSPQRIKLISLLSQGPKSVDQLAAMTQQSKAAASAHLKVLRGSGLVIGEKSGRHVWCRLANDNVGLLWLAMRNLGEELLPEVREIVRDYFEAPESSSDLSVVAAKEELNSDRSYLIDLRTALEYETGHIPSALNFPLGNLENSIEQIPPDRDIFTYCRGPYCLGALEGTELLRNRGLPAKRLRFGLPEWKASGLAVEKSEPIE
ncbi:MAG: metalloregulator ArsR/SmtB family transcription factor [Verrucomicrobiales bacterium]|nr:metalloregulator ArsR/SmtB family transcription factor [Verrucomicrobiales bacterium]